MKEIRTSGETAGGGGHARREMHGVAWENLSGVGGRSQSGCERQGGDRAQRNGKGVIWILNTSSLLLNNRHHAAVAALAVTWTISSCTSTRAVQM
jgi:hypothetical protein